MTEQQILEAVQAVKRVREQATFYLSTDLWSYHAFSDHKLCDYCRAYDGLIFPGDQLWIMFPYLLIVDKDLILPHVHMALWGKDTCRCTLVRISARNE